MGFNIQPTQIPYEAYKGVYSIHHVAWWKDDFYRTLERCEIEPDCKECCRRAVKARCADKRFATLLCDNSCHWGDVCFTVDRCRVFDRCRVLTAAVCWLFALTVTINQDARAGAAGGSWADKALCGRPL